MRLPPLAWWIMAVLTLVPVVAPMPPAVAVPFLAVYCLSGLWVGRARKRPTPAVGSRLFMGVHLDA